MMYYYYDTMGQTRHCSNTQTPTFDAILLDVDNGPERLTHSDNNWIYSESGLKDIYKVLRSNGMLAIWSAGPDYLFTLRLKKAGYEVRTQIARSRKGKGSKHTIFLARKVH